MSDSGKWVSSSADYLTPRTEGQRDAWAAEAKRSGGRGTQKLAEVTEVEPPTEIAEALGLKPSETAIVRRRVMYRDDQPVELVDSYYPASIARGTRLAEPRKIPGGAPTYLAELGCAIAESIDDVTARKPTENEQRALNLAADEPVAVLTRLALAQGDRPIEASVMTSPATGRHFQYRTKVG